MPIFRTDADRDAIARGTRRALTAKASRGEVVGELRYGQRRNPTNPSRVEACPRESRALRRIVELDQAGLGPTAIAAVLTREGHRPRGSRWWPESICRWLSRHRDG